MPRTASAGRSDASTASRTADVTALQMLSDDCSTISPGFAPDGDRPSGAGDQLPGRIENAGPGAERADVHSDIGFAHGIPGVDRGRRILRFLRRWQAAALRIVTKPGSRRQTLSTPRRFGATQRGSEIVMALRTAIQWSALGVWVRRRVADTTFGTIDCVSQKSMLYISDQKTRLRASRGAPRSSWRLTLAQGRPFENSAKRKGS